MGILILLLPLMFLSMTQATILTMGEYCVRNYEKVGCYEAVEELTLSITDRDSSSKAFSGKWLRWGKLFGGDLHSLACRCHEKAKEEGSEYFAIEFWAECLTGNITKWTGKSTKCANKDFKTCVDAEVDECAGKANTHYIYKANPEIIIVEPWAECSSTARNCICGIGPMPCRCDVGYTGNGHNCTDIDECALGKSNCSARETCRNTEGSFECAKPVQVYQKVGCYHVQQKLHTVDTGYIIKDLSSLQQVKELVDLCSFAAGNSSFFAIYGITRCQVGNDAFVMTDDRKVMKDCGLCQNGDSTPCYGLMPDEAYVYKKGAAPTPKDLGPVKEASDNKYCSRDYKKAGCWGPQSNMSMLFSDNSESSMYEKRLYYAATAIVPGNTYNFVCRCYEAAQMEHMPFFSIHGKNCMAGHAFVKTTDLKVAKTCVDVSSFLTCDDRSDQECWGTFDYYMYATDKNWVMPRWMKYVME